MYYYREEHTVPSPDVSWTQPVLGGRETGRLTLGPRVRTTTPTTTTQVQTREDRTGGRDTGPWPGDWNQQTDIVPAFESTPLPSHRRGTTSLDTVGVWTGPREPRNRWWRAYHTGPGIVPRPESRPGWPHRRRGDLCGRYHGAREPIRLPFHSTSPVHHLLRGFVPEGLEDPRLPKLGGSDVPLSPSSPPDRDAPVSTGNSPHETFMSLLASCPSFCTGREESGSRG